jgi:hypothetical protein
MKPYEDFIKNLKQKEGVWKATRAEIAEHVLLHYPEMTLSSLYPNSVPALESYGFVEVAHECVTD